MGEESDKKTTGKRLWRWLLRIILELVLVLGAIAAVALISKMPKREQEVVETEAPPVNVSVITIEATPELADTFELPAVVEPNAIVTVSAEVAGTVERLGPDEGSEVRAGELLIELNTDLVQPEFQMAEAQVERDKIEYDRMAELVDLDATSQSDLDNAKTQWTISKARLEEVRARLERTKIVSPAAGVLNDLPVEEGEYVQAGTAVAEVVDTSVVKVVVNVPERDIAFFEVGQKAEVIVESKGDRESFAGPITFISELADARTRSTPVEITLENKDRTLRSGQIVRVQLTRRMLKDAIMIPLLAVIPMEEGYAAYVVNSSEAQRREVKLGIMRRDQVQIERGLASGDRLIVAGHRFVAPGQKVRVIPETE